MTLTQHIKELNDQTTADAKAHGATGWFLLHDDVEKWNKDGIHTPDELDHYLLVCEAYESYREYWGHKLNWKGLMDSTEEELNGVIEGVRKMWDLDRKYEEEKIQEAKDHETITAQILSAESSVTDGLMSELLEGALAA